MTRIESQPGSNRRARGSGPGARAGVAAAVLVLATALGVAGGSPQAPADKPAAPVAPITPFGPTPVGLPPGTTAPVGFPASVTPMTGGAAKAAGTLPAAAQAPAAAQQPDPAAKAPAGQPNKTGPLANPLLSGAPHGLNASPQLTPATKEKLAKYVAKLIDPETTLDLVAGQTRVLVLKNQPFRVQAGDESILAVNVITPRELLLQGKGIGATVLNIWFGDPTDPTKQETLTYLVRVFPDPEAKERLERAYKALEDDINRHFKDCDVRLKVVGDKLVVTGRVRDFVQGGQVLRIIRANAEAGGDVGRLPVVPTPAGPAAVVDPTGATNPPPQEAFASAGGPYVINLLEVAGEQQVMLRVIVAEVNRSAARSIGMNFSVTNNQGITVFSNNTGGLGVGGFAGLGAVNAGLGGVANLSATFNAGKVPVAINALKTLAYARSLAEPTLVTMNGVPANFMAGGQFPVPVIGGFGTVNGAGGLQGVAFVPFGVQLNFTPFVTDRDRIRLVLNASVSARDLSSGTNIGGSAVAGLNSRNVSTTVELRQGETLAVAGLIEYNLGADAQKIPFIGDIPGLNSLTGLQRVTAGEKELVIFITPELVRPLDPNQPVPLPGHEILDPNDIEFYLWGRLEGHCKDYRSPIRTDLSRIKQYYRIESANVFGPTGYTPIP